MTLTDIQKVRLRIGDQDSANEIFSDDEILDFIDTQFTINLASAAALTAMAASTAIVAKITKTGTTTTDRKNVSAALLNAAKALQAMDESEPLTDSAERSVSAFAVQDILHNDALRSS